MRAGAGGETELQGSQGRVQPLLLGGNFKSQQAQSRAGVGRELGGGSLANSHSCCSEMKAIQPG